MITGGGNSLSLSEASGKNSAPPQKSKTKRFRADAVEAKNEKSIHVLEAVSVRENREASTEKDKSMINEPVLMKKLE